jgi:hypothetical protein
MLQIRTLLSHPDEINFHAWLGDKNRSFLRALEAAINEGTFIAEQKASDDPATWVVRLPAQPRVRVRKRVVELADE